MERYGRLYTIKDNMVNKIAWFFILAFTPGLYGGSPECILHKGSLPHSQANTYKSEEGKEIYVKHCLTCHQTDGSGVPNMFPPIQKSDWVNGDKNKLINVLLNGLDGDIDVNGESFSQAMPKQDSLTDVQIAQLLTYIRQNFGNNADAVQPADVTNLRGKN
jgi:mono/diheme cytochrome c family protein